MVIHDYYKKVKSAPGQSDLLPDLAPVSLASTHPQDGCRDARALEGYHKAFNLLDTLVGERNCDGKVTSPRTQYNVSSHETELLNPDWRMLTI